MGPTGAGSVFIEYRSCKTMGVRNVKVETRNYDVRQFRKTGKGNISDSNIIVRNFKFRKNVLGPKKWDLKICKM